MLTNLEKILLAAVEDGLSSLGDSSKQAIFFHLENSFKIAKTDIPNNMDEFAKALEAIFGSGTSYIEKLIAKRLYEMLGLEFENVDEWNFLNHVDNVKKHLCSKGEITV